MSRTKSGEMPRYELLYLISNKYSTEETKPIMEKVNSLILSNQGKITKSVELGKKRLAYPIKGFRFGYYNLVEFDMPGVNLINVGNALRLMSEILRQQVVLKEIKTEEQINQDKKIAEKIAARHKEEKLAEEKIFARRAAPVSDAVASSKAADKDKVDLKDLDEKLDKILETDNLL